MNIGILPHYKLWPFHFEKLLWPPIQSTNHAADFKPLPLHAGFIRPRLDAEPQLRGQRHARLLLARNRLQDDHEGRRQGGSTQAPDSYQAPLQTNKMYTNQLRSC